MRLDNSHPRCDGRGAGHRDQTRIGVIRRGARLCALACLGFAAVLAASAPPALALVLAGEETVPAPAALNTSAPKLTGTPAPGGTLTCNPGAWSGSPSSFAYAWLRDGAPIPGQTSSSYTVQEADRGHALSCSVTARNEGGEYLLQGLSSASYEVEFHAESSSDYLSQEFKERPAGEKGDPVAATAGATTAGIDASLQRGGQIAGKLTAALTALPLKGIEVCAFGSATHFDQCAHSGAAGEYLISGLPSDSYQIEFRPVEPGQNYAPQYYSGKSKAAEFTPVAVAAGATTSGVDAALTAGGRITGTVTGSGSGPLARAEVCAEAGFSQCVTTDSSGHYTITNLATEKYVVSFNPVPIGEATLFGSESTELTAPRQSEFLPQFYSGKATYQEAEAVTVTAGFTTAEINATLETGGRIEGVVKAQEGGAPLANVVVCAEEAEETSHCTLTSASGQYMLEGLAPGSYGVNFFPITALFGYSIYEPERYKDRVFPEPGDLVTVMQNVTEGGVNAELPIGAQIKGRVTAGSSGTPLTGAAGVCRDPQRRTALRLRCNQLRG